MPGGVLGGSVVLALMCLGLITAIRTARKRGQRPRLDDGPAVVSFSHSAEVLHTETRAEPRVWRQPALCRYQLISDLGGVSFCGPPGIRVRPGDEYLLSVAADLRPVALANRTLGVAWDLRLAPAASRWNRPPPALIGAAAFALAGLMLIATAYLVDDALSAVEHSVRTVGLGADAILWLQHHAVGSLRAALLIAAAACGAGALACGVVHWIRRRRHEPDLQLWIRAATGPDTDWHAVEADASGQVVATSRRMW